MALGIVTALKAEAAPFAKCESGLLIASGGVGAGRAETAASGLIARGADGLVSCGYAGALDETLKAGDLLLPVRVIDPAGRGRDVSAGLRDRLRACVDDVRVADGPLVSTRDIVATPAEKIALRESSGATAVDMESLEIANVAFGAGLPFAALRVVLDTRADRLPAAALHATTPTGGVDYIALFIELARRPQDLPALLRIARRRSEAHRVLTRVAARISRA